MPLVRDEAYWAHVRHIVDQAPPLPKAAADLWRRALENAAAKPLVVALNPERPRRRQARGTVTARGHDVVTDS